MCGIVLATDINELIDLMSLNSDRGTIQYSVTAYSKDFTSTQFKFTSEYNPSSLKEKLQSIDCAMFYIGHLQSPTGIEYNFHPASNGRYHLFHNGMMKQKYIRQLQHELNAASIGWDTELMLMAISRAESLPDCLNKFEGTFACILVDVHDKQVFVFRNMLSPLFARDIVLSSKNPGSGFEQIKANCILKIDFQDNRIVEHQMFNNKELPYYFIGENA